MSERTAKPTTPPECTYAFQPAVCRNPIVCVIVTCLLVLCTAPILLAGDHSNTPSTARSRISADEITAYSPSMATPDLW